MRRTSAIALVAIAVVAISSMVGVSALLIVHRLAIGSGLLAPSYAMSRSADEQSSSSVEAVAAKVVPGVVTLRTNLADDEFHEGTGIIVRSGGLIMTNHHVVATATAGYPGLVSTLVKSNDGRTAPFTVVAAHPKSDIAAVRVQGVSALTPISFGLDRACR